MVDAKAGFNGRTLVAYLHPVELGETLVFRHLHVSPPGIFPPIGQYAVVVFCGQHPARLGGIQAHLSFVFGWGYFGRRVFQGIYSFSAYAEQGIALQLLGASGGKCRPWLSVLRFLRLGIDCFCLA